MSENEEKKENKQSSKKHAGDKYTIPPENVHWAKAKMNVESKYIQNPAEQKKTTFLLKNYHRDTNLARLLQILSFS